MKPIDFENVIEELKKLPNVTSKQAEAIATYLIKLSDTEVNDLFNKIKKAKQTTHFCLLCNNFSDNPICDICANKERNKKQLCIVSFPNDVDKIESTNSYTGKYFVLGDELDIKNKSPIAKSIIEQLTSLINNNKVQEVIIATNWTVTGVATAGYLKSLINQINSKISVFRIAAGLPINSALSYADTATLKASLTNKTKF